MRQTTAKLTTQLLILATTCIVSLQQASAHDYHQSLAFDDLKEAEPAWLIGLRPAICADLEELRLMGRLGIFVAHSFNNNLQVGTTLTAGLSSVMHFRLAMRLGLVYLGSDLSFGSGVSLGVLAIPRRLEIGFVPVWGAEVRYRLTERHFLTIFGEVDLLFEVFGFRDNRAMASLGLGWSVVF